MTAARPTSRALLLLLAGLSGLAALGREEPIGAQSPPSSAESGGDAAIARDARGSATARSEEAAPAADATVPEVESFLRLKFQEAKLQYERRNYQLAMRIADAILALAPEVPFREELRKLRRSAEGRHLSGSLLSVTFHPVGEAEAFPERVLRGFLRIENISPEAVSIGRAGAEAMIGQAEVGVQELYADGSEWSSVLTPVVRIADGIRIETGASHDLELAADLPRGPRDPVVQIVTVRGSLLPTVLSTGDEKVVRPVPWLETTCLVLPEDLAEVETRAFEQLQVAILLDDARRLLAAGAAWVIRLREDPEIDLAQRGRTIDLLAGALATATPACEPAIRRLLAATTRQAAKTREEWASWYRIYRAGRKHGE